MEMTYVLVRIRHTLFGIPARQRKWTREVYPSNEPIAAICQGPLWFALVDVLIRSLWARH